MCQCTAWQLKSGEFNLKRVPAPLFALLILSVAMGTTTSDCNHHCLYCELAPINAAFEKNKKIKILTSHATHYYSEQPTEKFCQMLRAHRTGCTWKCALSQLLFLPWPLPGKWLCRGCTGECGLQQRLERARPELPSLLPMTLIAPNHFVTPKRLA